MTSPQFTPPDIAGHRRQQAAEAAGEERERVDRVDDLDAGGVPVRAYVPDGAPGTLVFAHGGGFCFGDLDTHDAHCRRLANRTGWAVLAVGYRRPPEHPYPAAVQDMDAALAWLRSRDAAHGLPTDRLGAIGDSAGANLALGLALRHPDTFEAVILIYPFTDPACRFMRNEDADDEIARRHSRWYWKTYAGSDPDPDDPDLAPIASPHLGTLPRTHVTMAGRDHLLPENEELIRRMQAAGADVTTTTFPHVDHGFWRRAAEFTESEESLADIAAFLG